MKDLIDSLSLVSGAVVVAIGSAGIVWLLCSIAPAISRARVGSISRPSLLRIRFTGCRSGLETTLLNTAAS